MQLPSMHSKGFSHHAFEPVSINCAGKLATGCDQPKASGLLAIESTQHERILGAHSNRRGVEHRPIVGRGQQTAGHWEIEARGRTQNAAGWRAVDRCRSGRKALSTLGPASLNDFAAVGGRHSGTKTVVAFAFQHAGLESALHVPKSRKANAQSYNGVVARAWAPTKRGRSRAAPATSGKGALADKRAAIVSKEAGLGNACTRLGSPTGHVRAVRKLVRSSVVCRESGLAE